MTTRREIRRHTAEPIDSPPPKPPTPGASGRKSGAKRKAESSTADAIAPTATTTADITAQITEVATRLSTIHISNVFELITATESSQTVSTSAVIQDLSSRDQDENREPVLNRRGNNTTAKIEHNDLRTHQVLNHRKTSQSDALKRVTAVTAHSKIASLNVTITKNTTAKKYKGHELKRRGLRSNATAKSSGVRIPKRRKNDRQLSNFSILF